MTELAQNDAEMQEEDGEKVVAADICILCSLYSLFTNYRIYDNGIRDRIPDDLDTVL